MKKKLLFIAMLTLFMNNVSTQTTITDPRDGNQYQTVVFGDQEWFAENLRYLPSVCEVTTSSSTSSCYYVYGYSGTVVADAQATPNYATFGVLYNWYAAMNGAPSSMSNPSGVQGACPEGWHLPSDAEWVELENYLAANGFNYDGTTGGGGMKIAKSLASITLWNSSTILGAVGNDLSLNNSSGFNILPSGYKYNSIYTSNGSLGYFWTTFYGAFPAAWFIRNDLAGTTFYGDYSTNALSVRCLREYTNSVNQNNIETIQINPNPAQHEVVIKLDSYVNAQLQVFDAIGNLVLTTDLRDDSNTINVSSLSTGIYIFSIVNNGQKHQLKFLKK